MNWKIAQLGWVVMACAATLQQVAPMVTAFHLLVIPHHYCSEHETLEHDVVIEGYTPVQYTTTDALGSFDPSGLFPHEHRLCQLASQSQRPALEDSNVIGTEHELTLLRVAIRSTRVDRAHQRVALFVAPKQSPPFCASTSVLSS